MAIQPGIYQAKIVDYGIGHTKAGDPQVMILFEFNGAEGQRHEMTWLGTLKEGKGQEITLKALLTCGMRGNDIDALADGVVSNILDVNSPVNITLQLEPNQEGKQVLRVKWINAVGGKVFRDKLSRNEAKIKMGALNLKGAMAAVRAETGIKDAPRQQAVGQSFSPDDQDDIGF
jgi:hypothetical protein